MQQCYNFNQLEWFTNKILTKLKTQRLKMYHADRFETRIDITEVQP